LLVMSGALVEMHKWRLGVFLLRNLIGGESLLVVLLNIRVISVLNRVPERVRMEREAGEQKKNCCCAYSCPTSKRTLSHEYLKNDQHKGHNQKDLELLFELLGRG